TPAATSAAVMEPTEAPAIFLASLRTPLSWSAFTAPGSAAPLAPPPEKVISRTGGGGAMNRVRPVGPLAIVIFLPLALTKSFGWRTWGAGAITALDRARPTPILTPPLGRGMSFGTGAKR